MPGKVTPSIEDYLENIYLLDEGAGVRSTDIARMMGVSKPSVNRALGSLGEMNLIRKERYALVYLTEEGREKAMGVLRRHTTIRDFLQHLLLLDQAVADEEACKIEHAMSDETVRRIGLLLELLRKRGELPLPGTEF